MLQNKILWPVCCPAVFLSYITNSYASGIRTNDFLSRKGCLHSLCYFFLFLHGCRILGSSTKWKYHNHRTLGKLNCLLNLKKLLLSFFGLSSKLPNLIRVSRIEQKSWFVVVKSKNQTPIILKDTILE